MQPVSTHSRPKAAGFFPEQAQSMTAVSTHSRPKAAGLGLRYPVAFQRVSTHSRPKAAGLLPVELIFDCFCFNTQPPEGGWGFGLWQLMHMAEFQHTAARRRLGPAPLHPRPRLPFQHTAARRRLGQVSTHSRPKAAGQFIRSAGVTVRGFNTQPPEGGWLAVIRLVAAMCSFNTQPPEGGWQTVKAKSKSRQQFQHTAARRRLVKRSNTSFTFPACFNTQPPEGGWKAGADTLLGNIVSTHSRPKAAGNVFKFPCFGVARFNTQPPEGGWDWFMKK